MANICLQYFLRYELFSSLNFGQITDGQTDRQTDRQKVMYMSPLCISTGVLKNLQKRYHNSVNELLSYVCGYAGPGGPTLTAAHNPSI